MPRILDDKFIEALAQAVKLPAVDIEMFAATIRDAAHRFATTKAIPREVAIRNEIRSLYSAAHRHRCKETARLVGQLSPATGAYIQKRSSRVGLTIPPPADFLDPARRDKACETIVRLLRVGMKGGRVILHAPTPQPRPPRRDAELDLIMWIEMAYCEATGMAPALTADPRRPGPFARMVQTLLNKVAPGADAVGLLNELQQPPPKRRAQKRRARKEAGPEGAISETGTGPKT